MGKNDKSTQSTFPWKEIFGFLGVVVAAYIGYLGIRSQIEIPIQATQTAEAKLPPFMPTLAPSELVPIITVTNIIPQTSPSPTPTLLPIPQEVQWIPDNDGMGTAGLCINDWDQTPNGPICPHIENFITWDIAKTELEQKVLPFVLYIPSGSTLRLKSGPNGELNWIIQVIDLNGTETANVWIGNDPLNSWRYDGLVRVGYPSNPMAVWATFSRYSDNSYRMK